MIGIRPIGNSKKNEIQCPWPESPEHGFVFPFDKVSFYFGHVTIQVANSFGDSS